MAEEFKNPKTDLYKYLKARDLEKELADYETRHPQDKPVAKSMNEIWIEVANFCRKWLK